MAQYPQPMLLPIRRVATVLFLVVLIAKLISGGPPADNDEYDTEYSFYGTGRFPIVIGGGPRLRDKPTEPISKAKNVCGNRKQGVGCGSYNFLAQKNLGNGVL